MPTVLNDPTLDSMLPDLHRTSKAQDEAIDRYFFNERTGPWNGMEPRDFAFMADKFQALDQDKAEFCYLICRATGARRVVEVGTSFGVSTLYLAAAVRDNGGGVVFAAEIEPAKVAQARATFEAAGLSSFIELHEADAVDACVGFAGPIDFVLLDIAGTVARPVLETLLPRLRAGAVVCTDNKPAPVLLEVLQDTKHGFRTMNLPFDHGLELSVKL